MKVKINVLRIIFMLPIICFISSCEGDCKDVQIETVEWITTYENKRKDTLVSYSITQDKRKYYKSWEEIKHSITIRNNNSRYSGKFSLSLDYGYYDDSNEAEQTKTKDFNFVTIPPHKSHTFTFWSQAIYKINFNSNYTVLQRPVTYNYQIRRDSLKIDTITVNSCEENIEALREKYRTIKKIYQQKSNNPQRKYK